MKACPKRTDAAINGAQSHKSLHSASSTSSIEQALLGPRLRFEENSFHKRSGGRPIRPLSPALDVGCRCQTRLSRDFPEPGSWDQ